MASTAPCGVLEVDNGFGVRDAVQDAVQLMSGEDVLELLAAFDSRPSQLDVLEQARPNHDPDILISQLAAGELAQLPRHRAEPSDQACHRLFNSGALSLNGRRILALVNGDGRRVRDDRLSNTLASGAETPTLPLAGYPDPRNPYCPSANPNPYPYPYPKPGRGPVQVPVGRGRAEQGGVGSGHVRGRAKDAPALGGAAGAPYRREPAIQEHRVAAAIQQRVWGCNGRDRPGVCPTALTLASNPEPSREPNPTEPYPQPYPQPQPCPRHWPSPQPASLAPLLHGRFVRSLTRSGSCCRPSWFEQRGASRGWPRMRPTRRHGAWTWSPSSAIRLRGPPRCVRS